MQLQMNVLKLFYDYFYTWNFTHVFFSGSKRKKKIFQLKN